MRNNENRFVEIEKPVIDLTEASEIVKFNATDTDHVLAEVLRDDNTVTGSGKTHFMATNFDLDRYRTLCGIEDTCGFWPFSSLQNHKDEDFCGRCRVSIEAAIKKRK